MYRYVTSRTIKPYSNWGEGNNGVKGWMADAAFQVRSLTCRRLFRENERNGGTCGNDENDGNRESDEKNGNGGNDGNDGNGAE